MICTFHYYYFANFLISFLSFFSHSVVLWVVIQKRLWQTVTHILVVNLALAHLLSSSICVPLEGHYLFNDGSWLAGSVVCKIERYLYMLFTSAAFLTLSAIAIDR